MKLTMSDLRELPNIGTQLAWELSLAGIVTPDQLTKAGSLNAAARLQEHGVSICRNKLCALEGAILGLRWHRILSEERAALWSHFVKQEGSLPD
ncbi:TfoX/Sxy family DNA transformation protein [Candidatus Bipolaricaulota bacterium]